MFILALYNGRNACGMGIPEGFPVKISEKTGEVLPDLPRIPSGPRDAGVIVGRSANVRKLVLSWNGENISENLDAAAFRLCSDGNNNYTAADVLNRVRAHDVDPFDGSAHDVKFSNGTLTLRLPGKKTENDEG